MRPTISFEKVEKPKPIDSVGRTKKIDDFIVQLGSSAKEGISENQLKTINDIIGSYDLSSKFFTFGGISGSQNLTISGKELGERTVLAVINHDVLNETIGGKAPFAFHLNIDLDDRFKNLLKKEGIKTEKETTNAIFFVPKFLEHINLMSETALHEIGHAASAISGAAEIDFAPIYDAYEQFNRYQSQLEVSLEHADRMQVMFSKAVQTHGLEEGRAEASTFANIEKKLLDTGTPIDNITKRLNDIRPSAYLEPRAFYDYFERHSSKIQSVYEKLGDNIQNLPSLLTGKTGLTVSEMMTDMRYLTAAQAAGRFQGTLENMTGQSGKINRDRIIAHREVIKTQAAEHLSTEQVSGIMNAMQNAASDTVSQNRSLSILGDSARSVEAKIVSSRPTISLVETASHSESVMQATRQLTKTSEMLGAATRAAESVAKQDSVGLKILGAASTIFRGRL